MSTTEIDIHHVARLAKIALSDDEARLMQAELAQMLAFFSSIQGVAVPADAEAATPPEATKLRPDVAGPTLNRAEALAEAPAHDGSAFTVPRVV